MQWKCKQCSRGRRTSATDGYAGRSTSSLTHMWSEGMGDSRLARLDTRSFRTLQPHP